MRKRRCPKLGWCGGECHGRPRCPAPGQQLRALPLIELSPEIARGGHGFEITPSRLKAELQTLLREWLHVTRLRAQSFDRFTERSDLVFFVCRRHCNAQARGAFRHGWITNRWNEKSFCLQRQRQIERRLLVAHDPWENRAARVLVGR